MASELPRAQGTQVLGDGLLLAGGPRHPRLFFIVKVDEKNVPPGTVLRDLEEIHSSLEPALPG